MFCTVALSFQSGRRPIKVSLTYKVGEHNVEVNDVVEVTYRGKTRYGVVSNLYSDDERNSIGLVRIPINRVLHTNTIYAAVRRRFNTFKDFKKIKVRKESRRLFEAFKQLHGDEYMRKIMKYVCLGHMSESGNGFMTVWHADHQITFRREENGVLTLIAFNKFEQFKRSWRTSIKAENYFNKLYDDYYGNS